MGGAGPERRGQRRTADPGQTAVTQPERLQFTVWTVEETPEQLHPRVLEDVVTQIQLCKTGRVGLERLGQTPTADRRQTAAAQAQSLQSAVWTLQPNTQELHA